MSIAKTLEKCKVLIAKIPRDVLIISILIITSSASFGFGYLAGTEAIEENDINTNSVVVEISTETEGKYVASRNGTKYYLPSCSGADRISEENKIWFSSISDAQTAGYSPAANCNGI